MKAVTTLVLLADESTLKLMRNDGVGKGLNELSVLDIADVAGVDVEFTERPGRGVAGVGHSHHGYEPRLSERDLEREGFARAQIAASHAEWAKGGYDRLVIAASPRLLGELRDLLPDDMAAALAATLDKNLTKIAAQDLPAHFARVAAF